MAVFAGIAHFFKKEALCGFMFKTVLCEHSLCTVSLTSKGSQTLLNRTVIRRRHSTNSKEAERRHASLHQKD